MRLVVLFLSICLLIGVLPAAAQEASFAPDECPVPVENVEAECGYVTVPAFHDNPDAGTFSLPVIVIESTSDTPAADPLIMGMGGPGGSAFDSILPMVTGDHGAALLEQRDVILFEQRGTKYTEPHLTCPEVTAVEQAYIEEAPEAEVLAAFTACHDRLAGEGVDMNAFTSVQSAADIPFIVRALGYEGQFNYYGVSYGTLLGQHLIRDYGDQLRSVILDGVVPMQGYWTSRHAIPADRTLKLVFDTCANDAACHVAYPDLETVFWQTVETLNANPVPLTVSTPDGAEIEYPLTGKSLVYAMVSLSYETDAVPHLPEWMTAIASGDYSLPQALAQVVLFGGESQTPGMRDAIICSEEGLLMADDQVDHTGINNHVVEAFSGDGGLMQRCAIWGVNMLDAYVNEPVVSDVPTLFLSGEFDPVTPPSHADLVSEHFSQHYSFIIPGAGHGTFLGVNCADELVLSFLVNPAETPAGGCVDSMAVQFALPGTTAVELAPVTLADLGVETVAPANWDNADAGLYTSGSTTLFFMSMPGDDAEAAVMQLAESFGLEAPAALDTISLETLNWSVYYAAQEGNAAMIVAAPYEGNTYLIILSGTEDDLAVLGESLLLPVVESFTITG